MEAAMNDGLERKVRSAAVAGWWTVGAGFAVLLVQWFAYLFMASARPAWATFVLGPSQSWDSFLNIWWLFTACFKAFLLLLALVCLWLTLLARELRKTRN
jgi:hypothetical protein